MEDIQIIDVKNLRKVLKQDELKATRTFIFDRLVEWMDRNHLKQTDIDADLLKPIRLEYIATAVK